MSNQGLYPPLEKAFSEIKAAMEYPKSIANLRQVGGEHYKVKAIEPWDYIIANNIGYLEGNIIKYISRWKDKNGLQDLEKARHYLDKLIETSYQEEKDNATQKQSGS